jgi:flagellar basal-body rod modification protein FlgD
MATTSAVSSTQSPVTSKPTGYSALTSEDFTKIIISELANQDPLSPSDTNALLQQLSTIRSIQSDIDLSDKLKTLVTENQLASASNMIGKVVGGLDEENFRVIGQANSVSKTKNGVFLNLSNGSRVNMNDVDGVIDPSQLTEEEKKAAGIKTTPTETKP